MQSITDTNKESNLKIGKVHYGALAIKLLESELRGHRSLRYSTGVDVGKVSKVICFECWSPRFP